MEGMCGLNAYLTRCSKGDWSCRNFLSSPERLCIITAVFKMCLTPPQYHQIRRADASCSVKACFCKVKHIRMCLSVFIYRPVCWYHISAYLLCTFICWETDRRCLINKHRIWERPENFTNSCSSELRAQFYQTASLLGKTQPYLAKFTYINLLNFIPYY